MVKIALVIPFPAINPNTTVSIFTFSLISAVFTCLEAVGTAN